MATGQPRASKGNRATEGQQWQPGWARASSGDRGPVRVTGRPGDQCVDRGPAVATGRPGDQCGRQRYIPKVHHPLAGVYTDAEIPIVVVGLCPACNGVVISRTEVKPVAEMRPVFLIVVVLMLTIVLALSLFRFCLRVSLFDCYNRYARPVVVTGATGIIPATTTTTAIDTIRTIPTTTTIPTIPAIDIIDIIDMTRKFVKFCRG